MKSTTEGQKATITDISKLTSAELEILLKASKKAERQQNAAILKAKKETARLTYENETRSISAICKLIKTHDQLREDIQSILDEILRQKGYTLPIRSINKRFLLETFGLIDARTLANREAQEKEGKIFKAPARLILTDSKGEKRRVFQLSQIFRAIHFRVNELKEAAKK